MAIPMSQRTVTDCGHSSTGALPTVLCYAFIIFGIACLAALLVELIALIVKKARKSEKKYTKADRIILIQQAIFAGSGIIYYLFNMVNFGTPTQAFVTISCILAAALSIISLANCGILCYNTIKSDVKTRTKVV